MDADAGPAARGAPDDGSRPSLDGEWCDRCGEALHGESHDACAIARALEPPRYCSRCRRRMKVQVLPHGWHATCVEHGAIRAR